MTMTTTTTKKKTALLRGPVLTMSGYGVHCRQVARWLFSQDNLEVFVEPLPWGDTHLIVDPEAENGLIGQVLQASTKRKDFYDLTFQVQLPNEWNPFLGDFNVGITAGVETDKCNPAWVDCVNRMDLVLVPSAFTKAGIEAAGKVTTQVVVVPESFPDVFLSQTPAPVLDLGLETEFNFLVVGQLTGTNADNDRKNLPYTMKWLAEAFRGNPNVGIVIKTNAGAQTQLDKRNVQTIFSKLVGEIVPPGTKGPRFYLLHGHMTDDEMRGLYSHPKIKALVSLTHGEGYGLPLLEAAACGLPIIATNWSGHLEFLKHGKFLGVDRILTEIPDSRVDGQIFLKGMRWASPFEQDAKRRFTKFHEAPAIPKAWAKELQTKVKQEFSFEAVSRSYSKALGT